MNLDKNSIKVILLINIIITIDLILKVLFFKMITGNLIFTFLIIMVSYIVKVISIWGFCEMAVKK